MAYQWILFDLDDTLFDFPAAEALKATLAHYSVTLTADMLADYQALNHGLWQQYNAGQINAMTLKQGRFRDLAPLVGLTPLELNTAFLQSILERSQPLTGVVETLRTLQGRVNMGIITNGFSDIQHARLQHSGLADCFEFMLVSEELGVNKPDPRIFQAALARMEGVQAADVLMVGDNPQTDVAGAVAVGMDSCWFTPGLKTSQAACQHVIDEFAQLLTLPRVQSLLLA